MRNDPQDQTGQKKGQSNQQDQAQERNRTQQAGQQTGSRGQQQSAQQREKGGQHGSQGTGQRTPGRMDQDDKDPGARH